MARDLMVSLQGAQLQQQREQLLQCNAFSARYGLKLTPAQAEALAVHRGQVLRENGRVEWRGGVLPKLIQAFCDSPYIYQDNYVETLGALQETFYCFKNEALDELSDDELIQVMKTYFDGAAQGSMEYLQETALEEICRVVRYGE